MNKYVIAKDINSILKHTSRTFYFSFSILPSYIRYMLSSAYLIARAMDSVIDSKNIKLNVKNEFLVSFSDIYDKDFREKLLSIKKDIIIHLNGWEKVLIDKFDYIFYKLLENMDEEDRKNLKFLICGISKGMRMDLSFFGDSADINSFKTYKDLMKYSNLIGGVPAIYWYRVYLKYNNNIFRNNVVKSAYRIGTALQLTNILKDMSTDLKNGRCYIPQEFLLKARLKKEELLDYHNIERVREFINSVILTCVDYFDEAETFIDSIKSTEISLKLALIWPVYWAMDSLYLVSIKNPLKNRIKISRFNVYKTLAKSPLLISSLSFHNGYRFRRETLILSINK